MDKQTKSDQELAGWLAGFLDGPNEPDLMIKNDDGTLF